MARHTETYAQLRAGLPTDLRPEQYFFGVGEARSHSVLCRFSVAVARVSLPRVCPNDIIHDAFASVPSTSEREAFLASQTNFLSAIFQNTTFNHYRVSEIVIFSRTRAREKSGKYIFFIYFYCAASRRNFILDLYHR